MRGLRWCVSGVLAACLSGAVLAQGPLAGSIVAWGDNKSGSQNLPSDNANFIALDALEGNFAALRADGSIVLWGQPSRWGLPTPNAGFTAVAVGIDHFLGLKADGNIVAWGRNTEGQCNVPTVAGGYAAVSAGAVHSLGLRRDNGSIVAWGSNVYGQCNVPLPNEGFVAIAAGQYYCLALRGDGSLAAWGRNTEGQCNVPVPNQGFTAIAAAHNHSLGLKANGTVVGWGYNTEGQCNVPVPNEGFTAIAAGYEHSLGLKANGTVVAWGCNVLGECNVPLLNEGFIAITGGNHFSLGIQMLDGPPTAKAGDDQTIRYLGTVVMLAGIGYDDNGPIQSYSWTLSAPEGSVAALDDSTSATPSFTVDVAGTYIATLSVKDQIDQWSLPDDVLISSENLAPTAAAGYDTVAWVDDWVLLSGAASTDPEGALLTYFWTLTAYPEGSTAVVLPGLALDECTFFPDLPGEYVLELVVDDGFGLSLADTVTVTVVNTGDGEGYVENAAAGVVVIVEALPPTAITSAGNQVAFNQFMTQAIQSVQRANPDLARIRLLNAIERTDGCVLRGQPDGPGPGRDWITDCVAQRVLYDQLQAALAALDATTP